MARLYCGNNQGQRRASCNSITILCMGTNIGRGYNPANIFPSFCVPLCLALGTKPVRFSAPIALEVKFGIQDVFSSVTAFNCSVITMILISSIP